MKNLIYIFLFLSVFNNCEAQVRFYPLDGNALEVLNGLNGTMGIGTAAPNPTFDRYGIFGSALEFDGNDYIQIPLNGLLVNEYSIDAWVTVASLPVFNSLQHFFSMGEHTTSGADQNCGVGNDQFGSGMFYACYVTGNEFQLYTDSFPSINIWMHYIAVFGSNYAKVFIDGILIDSFSTVGVLPDYGNAPNAFIGTRKIGLSHWKGKIDDFKFFNYALSDSAIITRTDSYFKANTSIKIIDNIIENSVTIKSNQHPIIVKITNTAGQCLYSATIYQETIINTNMLKTGIYLLAAENENELTRKTLMRVK